MFLSKVRVEEVLAVLVFDFGDGLRIDIVLASQFMNLQEIPDERAFLLVGRFFSAF